MTKTKPKAAEQLSAETITKYIEATRMPAKFAKYSRDSLRKFVSSDSNSDFSQLSAAFDTVNGHVKALYKSLTAKAGEDDIVIGQNVGVSPQEVPLYIFGPPQSFKTFFLTTALRILMHNNVAPVRYYSMDDVCEVYFNTTRPYVFRETFLGPVVIAVDNITAPKHEGQRNALTKLVRLRSDAGKATFYASDLSPVEFRKFYGLPKVLQVGSDNVSVRDDDVVRLIQDAVEPTYINLSQYGNA